MIKSGSGGAATNSSSTSSSRSNINRGSTTRDQAKRRSSKGDKKNKSNTKRRNPTYRWVGSGTLQADGSIIHDTLEIDIAGRPGVIRVGDSVLLCSSDIQEESLYSAEDTDVEAEGEVRVGDHKKVNRRSGIVNLSKKTQSEDSDLSSANPFVARVEMLWEDRNPNSPPGGSESLIVSDVYDAARKSRMKIRARWYFKKEDIASIGGTFLGANKKLLISSLGPRDLILGEETDDNRVSTVLGKCRVVRRRPLPLTPQQRRSSGHKADTRDIPNGAYTCKYDIHIPRKGQNGYGSVSIKSCMEDGEETKENPITPNPVVSTILDKGEVDASTLESLSPEVGKENQKNKRPFGDDKSTVALQERDTKKGKLEHKIEELAHDKTLCEDISSAIHDDGAKETSIGDGVANFTDTKKITSVISQGENDSIPSSPSATSAGGKVGLYTSSDEESASQFVEAHLSDKLAKDGKIQVGSNHQAVVPSLSDRGNKSEMKMTNTSRAHVSAWVPNKISDDDVNSFLTEASAILKDYMHQKGLEVNPVPTLAVTVGALGNENLSTGVSQLPESRKELSLSRECDEDSLLLTLHQSNYLPGAAMLKVKENPQGYLCLWSKEAKEDFNSGFRRYCGSLRMINKSLPSKTHKDVVDFHYRFKVPDQFRKYQEKKFEQARRMMESADKRLNGSGDSGSLSNKRVRSWTREGAAEHRRMLAKDFLVEVRNIIGNDKYLLLADCLKSYRAHTCAVPDLKEHITELLKPNTDLTDRFIDFLPRKHRA